MAMCEYRGPPYMESIPPWPDIGDPGTPGPMAPGRALPTGTDQTPRQGPGGLCIEMLSRVRAITALS